MYSVLDGQGRLVQDNFVVTELITPVTISTE
jgi:hypothetical protein